MRPDFAPHSTNRQLYDLNCKGMPFRGENPLLFHSRYQNLTALNLRTICAQFTGEKPRR